MIGLDNPGYNKHDPEEHYDFINLIHFDFYKNLIAGRTNETASIHRQINTIDHKTMVSSLPNKYENTTGDILVSRGFTDLERINFEVIIYEIEWRNNNGGIFSMFSYPFVCSNLNKMREKESMLLDPDLGPYGILLDGFYFSYNHPVIATARVKNIISSGFGGIVIHNVFLDDFNNECGNGPLPMLTAISKNLNQINKPITEDNFIVRGGIVLHLCYAVFVLGVLGHFIYWPIYLYRNKNWIIASRNVRVRFHV